MFGFTGFFAALYFISLLFTEQLYFLWFVPAFLILYLVTAYYKIKSQPVIPLFHFLLVSAVLVWLWLILALAPHSLSLPLSIQRWVTLALGLISFCFFVATPVVDKKKLPDFLSMLVLVNTLFVPINIFFIFFPQVMSHLPLGNLITYSVGHNHSYILYIFSLPFALQTALKSNRRVFWYVVTATLALGILLAFSRIGLFLLFLEGIYFGWLAPELRSHHRLTSLLRGASLVVLLTGLSFLLFSLNPNWSYGSNCRIPIFQTQLCKNIQVEARPEYWRQGLLGIKDHFLLGNGGHSFELISYKYRSKPSVFSQYPHNDYLQLIVEYGSIGLISMSSYAFLLYKLLKRFPSMTELAKVMTFTVGIVSLDALFNYNSNFPGIFLLSCVWLALTLQTANFSLPRRLRATISSWSVMILLGIGMLPLLVISLRFMQAELFYSTQLERYVAAFPFITEKASQVFQTPAISEHTRQSQAQLYRNHPHFHSQIIQSSLEPQKRFELSQQYLQLDPLNTQLRTRLMIVAIQLDKPEVVLEQARWLLAFFGPTDRHRIKDLDEGYLGKLIDYANRIAERQPRLASEITSAAYQFEPWRVNEVKSIFLLQPTQFETADVDHVISSLPEIFLWNYTASLNSWTMDQLLAAATAEDPDQTVHYLTLIRRHTDWADYAIWGKLSSIFITKLENMFPGEPNYAERRQLLITTWRHSLETLKKFGTVGGVADEWEKQLEAFN